MPRTVPINHYFALTRRHEVVSYSMLTYSGASLPETLSFTHGMESEPRAANEVPHLLTEG